MEPTRTIGVFGIVYDHRGKILLCHRRDYNLWNLPGGGLERDESPWDGVVREIKEETGLVVEIVRMTGVYYKPDRDDIVLSFQCEIVGGMLTLNDEADQLEYFFLDEMPHNTSPNQIERIRDAAIRDFTYRTQTGPSSIELIKQDKL